MPVLFFHGLESGPHGSKFQSLKAAFPDVISPDFEGILDIWERLRLAEEHTREVQGALVVGSSFGGLLAALLADRHPDRVGAMLLLAPALHLEAAATISRVPPRSAILHGRHDDIVPIEASRAFAEDFGVALHEVDDGHRLAASHPRIVALARELAPG